MAEQSLTGPTSLRQNKSLIMRNTLMLYARMVFVLLISLFTSRILLQRLGISDFGIYSVTGSLVIVFSFLNASMSGATSRFLTFEMGRNDSVKLKAVFANALFIHLVTAVVLVVLAETIGLWFLENKMSFPPGRLSAAKAVFQCSLAGCVVGILQVPFQAAVLAREKMHIYAYISMLEVFLKFIIAFSLCYFTRWDLLIVYAWLILGEMFIVLAIYILYTWRAFPEVALFPRWQCEVAKPLLGYVGWDLYTSFSQYVKNQGINIVQNIFFGTAINAAVGIAMQAQAAITSFAENFLLACRPQIVKKYASGKHEDMERLMFYTSKLASCLMVLISLPFLLECSFVLKLWLHEVPPYTAAFVRWWISGIIISVCFRPMLFAIQATGNVKLVSCSMGTFFLLVIPVSWVLLKKYPNPILPFIVNFICLAFASILHLYIFRHLKKDFPVRRFWQEVAFPIIGVICVTLGLGFGVHASLPESWTRLIVVVAVSCIGCLITSYYFVLNSFMRLRLRVQIKKKWKILIGDNAR